MMCTPKESTLLPREHVRTFDRQLVHIMSKNVLRIPETTGINIISSMQSPKNTARGCCCLMGLIGHVFSISVGLSRCPFTKSGGSSCLAKLRVGSTPAVAPLPHRSHTFFPPPRLRRERQLVVRTSLSRAP